MYAKGEAVAKDSAQAARWYKKAAEQGHAFAQHNLALLYAKGDGVARDPVEAFRWEQKAAEQGDPNAQYNLAVGYATGTGISRDGDQAYRWFRSAAAQGYPLQLEFEPGWTVGAFRAQDAGREVLAEFVRQGDDIQSWRELFTIQILPLSADRSPQVALDKMKALRERECPGTTTWHVIASDERSILYEWQARPCRGWPDQHEIGRILHARGNAFTLHYVVKSYRMPDDVRARWIARLAAAR
jgi:hypothetical protein